MKIVAKSLAAVLVLSGLFAQAEGYKLELRQEDGIVKQYTFIFSSEEWGNRDVQFYNPMLVDSNGKKYVFTNGMGWGTTPMNTICEQIVGGDLKFAAEKLTSLDSARGFKGRILFEPTQNSNGEFSHISIENKYGYNRVFAEILTCLPYKSDMGE